MLVQELEDVFLIPQQAVGQGPQGARVFIVEDDTVHARSVELGPVVDGRQVVLTGLEANQRIVVNGLVGLQDGMPVRVNELSPEEAQQAAEEAEASAAEAEAETDEEA